MVVLVGLAAVAEGVEWRQCGSVGGMAMVVVAVMVVWWLWQ